MHKKALNKNCEEDSLVLMEHAGRSETTRKVEAMVKSAAWEEMLWIHPEAFDCEKMIFNCMNGSIDLTSGRLLEHERKNLITKLSPIEYDPYAECPVWNEFLKAIFKKDKDLILYIQKVVGMCLTGDISIQAMFILYGTGANGKSTFIDTIMNIMGDYGATTPTDTLMQKKGDSASNDIARLQGARFVSAMEADIGGKLAEAIVKRLTGNDRISARFLYGEFFEFKPTFKIFMATNHKPNVTGMDEAIWRRLKLIPFEVTFKASEQDTKLPEKLEKEYKGILAWMVEGCILWQKEGPGNPPAILEATNQYRYEMSAVETFLQDYCRRGVYESIQSSHIYNAYKEWAVTNNECIMSNRAFGKRLAETGFDKVRRSEGNFWIGITLNN
jgi:putative DNA primase/helicase